MLEAPPPKQTHWKWLRSKNYPSLTNCFARSIVTSILNLSPPPLSICITAIMVDPLSIRWRYSRCCLLVIYLAYAVSAN